MTRSALLVVVIATAFAQQPSEPTELLAKARDLIVARGKRLPDYVCVQTVNRQYFKQLRDQYPPPSCGQIAEFNKTHPLDLVRQSTDRLRIQLKVSQGMEIGAWADASQFGSRSIFDLIGGGGYGTGTLGTFFGDIFERRDADYSYMGQTTVDGARLAAYGYQVPVGSSHYQVKTGAGWTPTKFSGIFWINADSLELRRLKVDANEMPPGTDGCQAETIVEYQNMKVGTGEFLLPVHSSMRMVKTDATETLNDATYTGCREYHGEATIRFDGGEAAEPAPTLAVPAAPLPPGLSLSLSLTSAIDTDSAAAGDIVTAKLRKPLRISKEVLAPAGANVEGRIVQMQHWLEEPRRFTICLVLESAEVHGRQVPLYAKLSREDESKGVHLPPWGQSPLAAALVFVTDKSRHVVPSGYQTNWITVSQPGDEAK